MEELTQYQEVRSVRRSPYSRCSAFPNAFRKPEGSRSLSSAPMHFQQFYRTNLCFASGKRLKSRSLGSLYANWAVENDAPGMSSKELKRAMIDAGHAHRHSNGIYFADVQQLGASFEENNP